MGTQLHIQTADLLKLNFSVTFTLEVYKEEGEPDYHDYRACVTALDTGAGFYMNSNPELSSLWIDYNEWGSNKAVIEPFIKKYTIPNIQS